MRSAYTPYISNLNSAFNTQNQNIASGLNMAKQGYDSGSSRLGSGLSSTNSALRGLFDDSVGQFMEGSSWNPEADYDKQLRTARKMAASGDRTAMSIVGRMNQNLRNKSQYGL